MNSDALLKLHRCSGATNTGYNRNVKGARILDLRTKRQRPKAKSNLALIKQIKTND